MSVKTRIILSVIIIIGAIFFTLKAKKEHDISQSTPKIIQEDIPLDTIYTKVSFTIKPYTQTYSRVKDNVFKLSQNYGEITRIFSADFRDTTDTLSVIDSTLPDESKKEYSQLIFGKEYFIQRYQFAGINGPNTFEKQIEISYSKGDSTSQNAIIDLTKTGYQILKEGYRNQLRVDSRDLAEYLVGTYLQEKGFPNYRFHVEDSIITEKIPETRLSIKGDELTYIADGETHYEFLYRAEVPKIQK